MMYFDDLKIGMTTDIEPALIKKEKMLSFAKDYDNVPLHTDEEYAKTTVFGKLIAPGVMSFLEVWAKYLEVDFFGEQLLAGKSTKIEWLKPVFADDVLTGKATVTRLQKRSEKNGLAEVSIDAYNQNGELILSAVTEAIVKCRMIKTEPDSNGCISIGFEEGNCRSVALDNGNVIGECDFTVTGSTWTITHTGVDPAYGGKGIAKRLVNRIIEEARVRQIKIIPLCSYAEKMMTGKEEYKDVLENNRQNK